MPIARPVVTPPRPATLRERLITATLAGGVALLRHLPEGLVFRAAYAAGLAAWLVDRKRRTLVRANLRQVCLGLQARGLASPTISAAASDERQLARLTRAAFGQWAVSYAESAVATGYSPERLRARVSLPTPAAAAATAALAPARSGEVGRIFVSPHFGAMELAGLYAVQVSGLRVWAPMETVANPALQAYFERTRGASGIGIVSAVGASSHLRDALAVGDDVAIVSDRPIGGLGVRVELLGAIARMPVGPAVLAVESGAPVYAIGVVRTGWGRWSAHIERLDLPAVGTRRERLSAVLDAQARAFERIISEAPEQWWACLFPIWERRG